MDLNKDKNSSNELTIPPQFTASGNSDYSFSLYVSSHGINYFKYFDDASKWNIETAEDHLLLKITTLISKLLFYIADIWCDFDIWLERKIVARRRKKKKSFKTNRNPRKIKDILKTVNILKWAKRRKNARK